MSIFDGLTKEERKKLVEEAKAEQESRNSEVTTNTPELTRNGAERGGTLDDITTALNSAGNMMTFGIGGALDRYVGGGVDYLMNETLPWRDGEGSYWDFVKKRGDELKRQRNDNPNAAMVGDIIGAIGSGAVAGPTILGQAGGRAAAPAALTNNMAGRSLLASGIGAAESAGSAAGRGEDTDTIMNEGALGAVGGALGNVAGEAAVRAGRGIGRSLSKTEFSDNALLRALGGNPLAKQGKVAAREMLEETDAVGKDANLAVGPRMSLLDESGAEAIERSIPNMRADNIMADVSDDLSDDLGKMLSSVDTDGPSMRPLKDLAKSRIDSAEDVAYDIVQRNLAPSKTRAQTKEAFEETQAVLNKRYENLFKSRAANTPVKDRAQVAAQLKRAFGKSMTNKTREQMTPIMRDLVGDDTALGTAGKPLTASDMLVLKKDIDDMLASHARALEGNNPSNLNKASVIALSKFKKYLNNRIGEALPAYKKLSNEFALNAQNADIVQMGDDMLKKTSIDPSEFKAVYDGLSDGQKQQFLEGAFMQLQQKVNGGELATLKRAAKKPAWFKKLQAVVPDGRLDKFLEEANQFTRELTNAYRIEAAAGGPPVSSGARYNPMAYKAAIAASAVQGRVASTAFPAAREIGGRNRAEEAGLRTILDLYSQQGPDAAANALNTIMTTNRTVANPVMTGRLGAMAMPDEDTSIMDLVP